MRKEFARLTLKTVPPSVNKATTVGTVNGKARKMKAPEYEAWLEAAHWELNSQDGIYETGYWRADILIPGTARSDLDNLLKGILDSLGKAKKTPDDRYLVDLRIRFHVGPHVEIAIKIEELHKWAKIKQASKSLIKRLAKCSR
tara:strand:- start:22090 stop:22518 length:429 start_codon:yes stop_codon:yes gene_type:complete